MNSISIYWYMSLLNPEIRSWNSLAALAQRGRTGRPTVAVLMNQINPGSIWNNVQYTLVRILFRSINWYGCASREFVLEIHRLYWPSENRHEKQAHPRSLCSKEPTESYQTWEHVKQCQIRNWKMYFDVLVYVAAQAGNSPVPLAQQQLG